jgi:hypothetical protein
MHQEPLQAPRLPNKSSSAGHKSGVTGLIVSFMKLPDLIPPRTFRQLMRGKTCYFRQLSVAALGRQGENSNVREKNGSTLFSTRSLILLP